MTDGLTRRHTRATGAASAPAPRLSLTVARGVDAGRHVEAEARARVSVGTAADNGFVLSGPTVSRYHLELEATDDGVRVRDLGSSNGTFSGRSRLRDADLPWDAALRLGDTVLVVSRASDAATEAPPALPGLVTVSPRMLEVVRQVRRLAAFGGSVLVLGETGTGKELVARALHDEGPRRAGPFVVVDCGALPDALVESELFGHERGAFTGAVARHVGAFERARGGTVFLDEIGELPQSAQSSLLGALERRRVRRVGGERELELDVRVVSATHRDLRAEVNRAAFRADLYYRLAGALIALPPLRERPEDVPALVEHFTLDMAGAAAALPAEVIERWRVMHWAGNVRELRNAVERALAGETDTSALPGSAPGVDLDGPRATGGDGAVERYRDARARKVAEFEHAYVTALLARTEGNASEAARLAKMDRPYLLSLLKRYGLR
ncbi:MAG TPA: sigma 54-interacting transcriptional regulator [Polyangiaceae bacterium]|nr:sigma 54-interacting transcriptional regulator [Polyangiaceae bacterium]